MTVRSVVEHCEKRIKTAPEREREKVCVYVLNDYLAYILFKNSTKKKKTRKICMRM